MVLAHDITKGDRTRDVKITQNITFETMLLAPHTLQGLKDAGFYKPSPIQLYGIPIGKCGFDLLLEAKSGTGKTAVFSIIALEKIDLNKGVQAVILTPTREIAAQICDVLTEIGLHYKGLQVAAVMGGLPVQEDIEKFKSTVHIVVGSPGRLKHLIQKKYINTSAVRLLVLDEADKLMEKAFQEDIRFIHTHLPQQKQVIMSSATYSDSAKTFINMYMQNANHVCPDSDSILLGIEQKVTFVKYNSNIVRHTQDRFKELLKILVKIQFKQCLVFCNYQARVSEVHKLLKKEKWPSEQLYGQQEQLDRLDALKTLQQYKCRILVSTDLAARGIDASNIDLIVNFEPPHEWQTYLHRIGRAGRFGSYGTAITILSEGKEVQRFKDMFKLMELSITMHHLWTEKEFKVDSLVTPPVSPKHNPAPDNIDGKVNQKDMWEMLSGKTATTNAIEPFESLCKFQEESETLKDNTLEPLDNLSKLQDKLEVTNIETFSDLMVSSQSQPKENSENICEFKHIEMKKPSPTKFVTKEQNAALLTAGPKANISEKELNHKENFTPNIKKELEQVEIDAEINLHNVNGISEFNTNIGSFENKLSYTDKLNLEKPTSLTTKLKANNDGWKKLQTIGVATDNSQKNYGGNNSKKLPSQSQSELNDAHSILNDLNTKNPQTKDEFYDTTNDSSSSDLQIEEYEPLHEYTPYSSNCYRKYRSIKRDTQMETYLNWYKQLKQRVQWIEQSIYINEISKI